MDLPEILANLEIRVHQGCLDLEDSTENGEFQACRVSRGDRWELSSRMQKTSNLSFLDAHLLFFSSRDVMHLTSTSSKWCWRCCRVSIFSILCGRVHLFFFFSFSYCSFQLLCSQLFFRLRKIPVKCWGVLYSHRKTCSGGSERPESRARWSRRHGTPWSSWTTRGTWSTGATRSARISRNPRHHWSGGTDWKHRT